MSSWGSQAWTFLHHSSFAYPDKPTEEQQKQASNFFESLSVMLPCPKCASHWTELLKEHPPDVTSRKTLTRWLWARHNDVNKRLGKKVVSFEHAKYLYDESLRKRRGIMSCLRMLVLGVLAAILFMFVLSWAVKSSCPCG